MQRQQGQREAGAAFGALLLLLLCACGGGTDSGSHKVVVSLHNERLSVSLRQASVGEVFAELARQTGFPMQVEEAAARETVSAEFTDLPFDEGVKRVLQGKNYVLSYRDERQNGSMRETIAAVHVLATRKEPLPSRSLSDAATGGTPRPPTSSVVQPSTEMGDRSPLASFLSAARDTDPQARKTAVVALGYLGDESAVTELGQLLLSDSDKNVRLAATEALAEIGSVHALGALRGALKDQDLLVQQHAAEAIAAIGGD